MTDIGEVDQWISQLSQCKQLSESDVKKLCDKVCIRPCVHVRPSQLIRPSPDTRDPHGGVQCPAGALPGHRVW
jgi:hypothetical protein